MKTSAGIHLFPSCDHEGLLLEALSRTEDAPVTRADAILFGWMLGLDPAIDAVGAARAVLIVAARQSDPPDTEHRQTLIEGLERFVADRGRAASLSAHAGSGVRRPRRRWRERPVSEAGRFSRPVPRRRRE